jgi:hypothetical protein
MESIGGDIEIVRRGWWKDKVGTVEFVEGQNRDKIIEKELCLVNTEESVRLGWWDRG